MLFDVFSDLVKMNINLLKTHTKRKYFSVQCSPTHEKTLFCMKVFRFSSLFMLRAVVVEVAVVVVVVIGIQ